MVNLKLIEVLKSPKKGPSLLSASNSYFQSSIVRGFDYEKATRVKFFVLNPADPNQAPGIEFNQVYHADFVQNVTDENLRQFFERFYLLRLSSSEEEKSQAIFVYKLRENQTKQILAIKFSR